MQFVLAVDLLNSPIGLVEKKRAHSFGILHRAFSIFLFRSSGTSLQTLLQKRANKKYHSGGLWTNTCCSHAEKEVSLRVTAQNRLEREMGFSCQLHPAGLFYYKANVNRTMIEHEIDHVFVGFDNPKVIRPHPQEVQAYQWIDVNHLLKLFKEMQKEFTPWFFEGFQLALRWVMSKKDERHLIV